MNVERDFFFLLRWVQVIIVIGSRINRAVHSTKRESANPPAGPAPAALQHFMHVRKKSHGDEEAPAALGLNPSALASAHQDERKRRAIDGERKRLECTSTEPSEGAEQRGRKQRSGSEGGNRRNEASAPLAG